jgi:hypothetical protein
MAVTKQDDVGVVHGPSGLKGRAAAAVSVEERDGRTFKHDPIGEGEAGANAIGIIVAVYTADGREGLEVLNDRELGHIAKVNDQVGVPKLVENCRREHPSAPVHVGIGENDDVHDQLWNVTITAMPLKIPWTSAEA